MNCKLIGNIFHSLEVTLEPRETFYAEKGALVYMDGGIEQQIEMNGSGFAGMLSSKLSGESLFIMRYTNTTNSPRKLVVSGRSGSLKYIKIHNQQNLIIRTGDYVASNNKVSIDINFSLNKMLMGAGFTFQKITGESTVFFNCIDSLIDRNLSTGEEIIVDEDHIKALLDIDDSRISVQRNTNILRNILSGEGFLMTRIIGPGHVFLSSLPHNR